VRSDPMMGGKRAGGRKGHKDEMGDVIMGGDNMMWKRQLPNFEYYTDF